MVVIVGLYFGRQALIPLALATVLAFLLAPVVGWLEKCRCGRLPAVAVVLVLAFALAGTVGWLVGRYAPQLSFLDILLGDEPGLPLEAQFYQRLLALDQDEARHIAEIYLKEKPLGSFYDSVLIPALALAEQDRHLNSLEAETASFVSQSVRELIEELGERLLKVSISADVQ